VNLYAGIDESGYGPLLGPLVVTRAVFSVGPEQTGEPPACLWNTLDAVVCRRLREAGRDPRHLRIAINDSKLLYNSTAGLRHLERGVLALLPGVREPRSLAELLEALATDAESAASTLRWYRDAAGGPELPAQADPGELSRLRGVFGRTAALAGVKLEELRATVVYEDRFNRLVARCGSKAQCAWEFVAAHLSSLWEGFGSQNPYVVLDRQGGRRSYGPLLVGLAPRLRVEILEESPTVSRYRLSGEGRSLRLEVRVGSERRHLPVAYASMVAKYLRELLMLRFQRFWSEAAPEVRPTAGYFSDGSRFLRELEPHLRRLGLRRELLARCR
jgi:hypothetical protein